MLRLSALVLSAAARPCFALAAVCALLGFAAPAGAKGILRVQQSNGTVQVYDAVVIRLVSHKALTITSADGKGSLRIDQAACSYAGQLRSCLLYHMTWTQAGETHPIDLVRGTIYVNLTAQQQALPLSSQQLPPNGLLMSFQTKRGTYVSLTGVLDEVTK